jgi:hypothetical protein
MCENHRSAQGWRADKGFRKRALIISMLQIAVFTIICMVITAIHCKEIVAAPSEYEIKAAFLYNFANFVEWPPKAQADANGTIIIGILGDDPFGSTLEQIIANKTINGHRIEIKRFKSLRELKPCHILFINSSEDNRLEKILNIVEDWHVLTVSEIDGFTKNGGIINFYVENKRVRFEINTDNAKKMGLKISSKLLKLAKIVRN